MANPFGIEQVDIPSMLGMHQQMKRQRIADLMQAKQYERQDRQDQMALEAQKLRQQVFQGQPKGGDPQSGGTGAATRPPTSSSPASSPTPKGLLRAGNVNLHNRPVVSNADGTISTVRSMSIGTDEGEVLIPTVSDDGRIMTDQEAVDQYRRTGKHLGIFDNPDDATAYARNLHNEQAQEYGSDRLPPLDQPLPPRTDGLSINMQALQQLYAIDPEGAAGIQKMVYDSDKQQLEKAQARGEAMAVAATSLRNLPAGQRQAEFQRNWAPYLIERGYDPAMLQQADLSDDGLERYYRQGRSIEKIVSSAEGERDYRLRVQNQQADNARADAGLGIRERALKLAQQREGRLATGKGADGDNSDLNYLIGD